MLRLIGAPAPEQTPTKALPTVPGDPLRALVARVISREAGADRTLLIAVGPAMLGLVRRVLGSNSPDLEDVCQESALGLLTALPTFRAECSVLHFACRVALLTALATRRRRDRISRDDDSIDLDRFIDDQPSPAELVDATRRRQCLRRLLDELPLGQAEVLALHVMLGYTVEETGAMTHAPINTVRSRLRRGLAALRDALADTLEPHETPGDRDD